jgi:hypothetical protein
MEAERIGRSITTNQVILMLHHGSARQVNSRIVA